MNNPALKGEVSDTKTMLTTFNPRLRRTDIMFNSFASCISNASEEFSRTPEMSMSEVSSQPRMFLHQIKSRIPFQELQSSTNTHSRRKLNKNMHMVNSNMKLIDSASISSSGCVNKSLTINLNSEKLERIHCIFGFPNQVESILSESMFEVFQFHFFAPQTFIRSKVLTMFDFNLVQEGVLDPSWINNSKKLNLLEEGNSSLCLKAEVSLPLM